MRNAITYLACYIVSIVLSTIVATMLVVGSVSAQDTVNIGPGTGSTSTGGGTNAPQPSEAQEYLSSWVPQNGGAAPVLTEVAGRPTVEFSDTITNGWHWFTLAEELPTLFPAIVSFEVSKVPFPNSSFALRLVQGPGNTSQVIVSAATFPSSVLVSSAGSGVNPTILNVSESSTFIRVTARFEVATNATEWAFFPAFGNFGTSPVMGETQSVSVRNIELNADDWSN